LRFYYRGADGTLQGKQSRPAPKRTSGRAASCKEARLRARMKAQYKTRGNEE
jgi:hypothetical protein